MRYAFVRQHAKELPVTTMCRVLRVSRSGYYDWVARPAASDRQRRRAELTGRIRQVHRESRQLYGSPRIHAELKEQGVTACENSRPRGFSIRIASAATRTGSRTCSSTDWMTTPSNDPVANGRSWPSATRRVRDPT